MSERSAPPTVTIRRYLGSRIYEVVVVVRGREMVLRCETYSQALQWARQECKSYNVPEPALELPDDAQSNDLPIFLRSQEQSP
jgi:hypothetical protein